MFGVTGPELVEATDAAHARMGRAQRELLALVAEVDRTGAWEHDGARDAAHWLSMRYGISTWKAHRWVAAAHALEHLPGVAAALRSGELGIDKVAELCRFATPGTEEGLVRWAQAVSVSSVRHRGDLAARACREELVQAERDRSLEWWYTEEGRRLGLQAELPAAQGEVVVRAIERMAERVPAMPEEDDASFASARRADALVALCSARVASDPDPDRATVVVHIQAEERTAEIEGGPAVFPETAQRLACDARVQAVVQERSGNLLHVAPITRTPPAWMVRQVRYRDRGCRFPGCGTKAFTQAHHIRWWRHGGRTELSNLVLICSFHHRLVHEHGWRVERDDAGFVRWSRPDGTRYRAGPSSGAGADGALLVTAAG